MHTPAHELAAQVKGIRDRFVIPNTHFPERIHGEGTIFVGFADDCHVRQSPIFFDAFVNFLQSIGDASFFFLWLDAPLDMKGVSCGLSLHSLGDCNRPTNFVRLQASVPDEVLSGETWFISSMSGRWAIYGEQYGSELAVFLASDDEAAEKVRLAFKGVLADAVDAANELGDPSETGEGKAFNDQLIQNYRTRESLS